MPKGLLVPPSYTKCEDLLSFLVLYYSQLNLIYVSVYTVQNNNSLKRQKAVTHSKRSARVKSEFINRCYHCQQKEIHRHHCLSQDSKKSVELCHYERVP